MLQESYKKIYKQQESLGKKNKFIKSCKNKKQKKRKGNITHLMLLKETCRFVENRKR